MYKKCDLYDFKRQSVCLTETINMSSLGCGSSTLPTLLLQYSYYLNNNATKCVNIGLDTFTFAPRMILFNPTQQKGVHLTSAEWTHLHTTYQDGCDFLTYKTNTAWFSTPNISIKSYTSNTNVRLIKLQNKSSGCRKVSLNFIEWENLKRLTTYLNQLMNKFIEISPAVAEYYELYLQQCRTLGKAQLTYENYFTTTARTGHDNDNVSVPPAFNSHRLFTEIPIVCGERLFDDVHGLRSYLTDDTTTI